MTDTNKEYSYEDMVKLRNEIHKIKNKDILLAIKNIIIDNNPSHSITKNENGLYLCFHNLIPETYSKISSYIKSSNKTSKLNSNKSENDNITTDVNNSPTFDTRSKLKYSNKEKSLIKRKIYDNELKNQNINSEGDDSESVFIKPTTKK
jgi:hypothetical protein